MRRSRSRSPAAARPRPTQQKDQVDSQLAATIASALAKALSGVQVTKPSQRFSKCESISRNLQRRENLRAERHQISAIKVRPATRRPRHQGPATYVLSLDNTPTAALRVGQTYVNALLDTGAQVNLVRSSAVSELERQGARRMPATQRVQLRGAFGGKPIIPTTQLRIPISVGERSVRLTHSSSNR